MFRYIKGTLEMTSQDSIVVENHGIGYVMIVPASVMEKLPPIGNEVKIYTYVHVREDILQLFGFFSMDDLDVFQQLITVSGIGPKGGIAILSTMSADDLRFAVMADDAKSISKAPGIGAKTAQKLILELKDKLKIKDVVENMLNQGETEKNAETKASTKNVTEAVEALAALGYPAGEAMKAVKSVSDAQQLTTEELLKEALKKM